MSTLPDPVFDHEEAAERGFYGYEVDPTPNENYTVKGGPTPETDAEARKAARDRREELLTRLSGIGLAPTETAPTETATTSTAPASSEES